MEDDVPHRPAKLYRFNEKQAGMKSKKYIDINL